MLSIVHRIGGYKSPFPTLEKQSTSEPNAQRDAFHCRDVRVLSRSFFRCSPPGERQPQLHAALCKPSANKKTRSFTQCDYVLVKRGGSEGYFRIVCAFVPA